MHHMSAAARSSQQVGLTKGHVTDYVFWGPLTGTNNGEVWLGVSCGWVLNGSGSKSNEHIGQDASEEGTE